MEEAQQQRSPFAGQNRISWALRRAWRTRVRSLWRDIRAPLIIVLGFSVIVLGTIGFAEEGLTWWESLFKSFQLYTLAGGDVSEESPTVLNVARILGPVIVGLAAVKGLLILSREQLRLVGFRLFRRRHIVIVGLGDVGFGLADNLNELGARVIAIDHDATNPAVEGCKERGISVLIGDATDPDVLRAACVDRARHLIVASGGDSVAVDVVAAATEVTTGRAHDPLQVIAHIEDRALWQALQARTLSRAYYPSVSLELFNLYDAAGRRVLDMYPPFTDEAAAGRRGPRVLIVADQAIAEVLVVNVARLWRNSRVHGRARISIAFAGPGSEEECARIRERYPAIDAIADLEPWPVDIGSAELREGPPAREAEAIYVALGDEASAAATALTLAATNRPARGVTLVINDKRLGERRRAAPGHSGAALIAGDASMNLFGILSMLFDDRFLVGGLRETIAHAIHDGYQRTELAKGGEKLPYVKPWSELDEDAKSSNRDSAADIPRKLAALGCVVVPAALADAERSRDVYEARLDGRLEEFAEAEHERWAAERTRSGWRPGPTRDNAAKVHPSLKPYEALSDAEKEKDRNVVRELPDQLARAGFAIEAVPTESGSALAPLPSAPG